MLACIGAPVWALWKWRGGWRLAAVVPVAVMAFVVGRIVVDTSRDPTSHNLWPFEIILYSGAAGRRPDRRARPRAPLHRRRRAGVLTAATSACSAFRGGDSSPLRQTSAVVLAALPLPSG